MGRMRNGNNEIGTCFTFAIVLRGELSDINKLIDFLKNSSNLKIAHQQIGQEKMYIASAEALKPFEAASPRTIPSLSSSSPTFI